MSMRSSGLRGLDGLVDGGSGGGVVPLFHCGSVYLGLGGLVGG